MNEIRQTVDRIVGELRQAATLGTNIARDGDTSDWNPTGRLPALQRAVAAIADLRTVGTWQERHDFQAKLEPYTVTALGCLSLATSANDVLVRVADDLCRALAA